MFQAHWDSLNHISVSALLRIAIITSTDEAESQYKQLTRQAGLLQSGTADLQFFKSIGPKQDNRSRWVLICILLNNRCDVTQHKLLWFIEYKQLPKIHSFTEGLHVHLGENMKLELVSVT